MNETLLDMLTNHLGIGFGARGSSIQVRTRNAEKVIGPGFTDK